MKNFLKLLSAMLVSLFLVVSIANARDLEGKALAEKKMSVGMSVFTFAIPILEFPIGFMVNPHLRLNIAPTYISSFYGSSALKSFLIGGTMSGTVFFDDWKGWYVEPGFLYLHGISTKSRRNDSVDMTGFQLIGGYEKVWDYGLYMNFGFGLGVGKIFYDDRDNYLRISHAFPYPTGNALLGYRF